MNELIKKYCRNEDNFIGGIEYSGITIGMPRKMIDSLCLYNIGDTDCDNYKGKNDVSMLLVSYQYGNLSVKVFNSRVAYKKALLN